MVDAEEVKRAGKWKVLDKEDRRLVVRVLVLFEVLLSAVLNERGKLPPRSNPSLRGVGCSPITSRCVYSVFGRACRSSCAGESEVLGVGGETNRIVRSGGEGVLLGGSLGK